MRAGKTHFEVGTEVRITKIASRDEERRAFLGKRGRITHPFPGLLQFYGRPEDHIAGIWIARDRKIGNTPFNLMKGDQVQMIYNPFARKVV